MRTYVRAYISVCVLDNGGKFKYVQARVKFILYEANQHVQSNQPSQESEGYQQTGFLKKKKNFMVNLI